MGASSPMIRYGFFVFFFLLLELKYHCDSSIAVNLTSTRDLPLISYLPRNDYSVSQKKKTLDAPASLPRATKSLQHRHLSWFLPTSTPRMEDIVRTFEVRGVSCQARHATVWSPSTSAWWLRSDSRARDSGNDMAGERF